MLTQRARLGAAILAVLVLTGTAVAQDRAAGGIPKIDLDPGDAAYWDGYDVRIVRVAVRKQLETVSGGVSTACPDDELSAFIQFGLVSSGLLQYVEVVRSSGLKQCDDAMVGAIRAAAPYRVGSRLIPRPDGPSLVVSARLLEGRFAGTVLRQNRTVVSRSPQTFEIRASAPTAAVSAAQPLLPLALLGVAAVGLGAGLWRLRRRRLAPPPMSRDAAVTHARSPLTTVPAPLIRQTAGEAAADRFRLAIDFSDRQAMLDFVDLLKRDELLPSTAQAQPVDAAAPVLSPATETYVVTRREADGSPRPTA